MRKIILASGSKSRKMVIDVLNIPYIALPADIDEKSIRDSDFAKRAERIARAKVEAVAKRNPNTIVIGADSFGVINGREYEKPVDLPDARRMLLEQSGQSGTFYTGFCYLDIAKKINFSTTDVTNFTFRTFSENEIESYIMQNPVLTWSGAMFPGGLYGSTFVEKIHGSLNGYTHGLPTHILIPLLSQSGVAIHA